MREKRKAGKTTESPCSHYIHVVNMTQSYKSQQRWSLAFHCCFNVASSPQGLFVINLNNLPRSAENTVQTTNMRKHRNIHKQKQTHVSFGCREKRQNTCWMTKNTAPHCHSCHDAPQIEMFKLHMHLRLHVCLSFCQ